ncbi:MAG: hypothetical protein ACUVR0_02505 [Candidatus Aminicenantales bacterium]
MKKNAVLGLIFFLIAASSSFLQAKPEMDSSRCEEFYEACFLWVVNQNFGFIKTINYLSQWENLYYLCLISQVVTPYLFFWFRIF